MYNNEYEEYITNVLGIRPKYDRLESSSLENTMYNNQFSEESFTDSIYGRQNFQNNNISNEELERLYPDLYRLLYPMVQSACMKNTRPITEETINNMVEEIYSNFVCDDTKIVNINLNNDVRSSKNEVKSNVSKENTNKTDLNRSDKQETRNLETEDRQFRPNNHVLNDLIRILLIRELIGRPGVFPPFRPGFPGGRPPQRPPMRPRYDEDYFLY